MRFFHRDFLYRGSAEFHGGPVLARADERKQGSPVSRPFLRFERGDALIEDVSEKLVPKRTFCAASGQPYTRRMRVEFTNNLYSVFLAVADAFEYGAHQVGTFVSRGQSDPCSACAGIQMRCSLAHQI